MPKLISKRSMLRKQRPIPVLCVENCSTWNDLSRIISTKFTEFLKKCSKTLSLKDYRIVHILRHFLFDTIFCVCRHDASLTTEMIVYIRIVSIMLLEISAAYYISVLILFLDSFKMAPKVQEFLWSFYHFLIL